MTTIQTPVDNGVNVEALLGVRKALADTPEIAQFQWRTTVSWVSGTHSRSSVDTFHGFGEQQQHKTTFTYDVDHPLAFAAQDNGITPVEYVLVALAAASPPVSPRWPSSAIFSCVRCRRSLRPTTISTESWVPTPRSATASPALGSAIRSTPTPPPNRSKP